MTLHLKSALALVGSNDQRPSRKNTIFTKLGNSQTLRPDALKIVVTV
jgi:hypothetical protein